MTNPTDSTADADRPSPDPGRRPPAAGDRSVGPAGGPGPPPDEPSDRPTQWPADQTPAGGLPSVPPPPDPIPSFDLPAGGAGGSSTRADRDPGAPFLSPPAGPDEIGRLGGYRVLAPLGGGGMGLVFRAEDVRLRRPVALKVVRPDRATDDMRRRFLREARAAAKVEHDHVVPIFQVGEDNGLPFLAMPLLKGRPLSALTGRPLPVPEVVRIGREVALGLQAAHEVGLVHRDIKPGNLWVEAPTADDRAAGRLGRVKVLDFGLARVADDESGVSAVGAVLGTPGYLAPEQADGRPVTPRADLFSLGCVLFQLATGRPPFEGATALQLIGALALQTPPPAAALNPAVPPALSDLIGRLLDKDPARRPATAAGVAAELRRLDPGRPGPRPPAGPAEDPFAAITEDAGTPPARSRPTRPAARPLRLLAGAAALALVLAGAAAAWLLTRGPKPEPTGSVAFRCDLADARVQQMTFHRDGREPVPVDPVRQPGEVRLPAGRYEVRLAADPDLAPNPPAFDLPAGGSVDVRVVRKAAGPPRWPPPGFAGLPPADQLRRVGAELARRNVGFDPRREGAFGRHLADGPVLDVYVSAGKAPLTDLGPLAALPRLSQVTITTAGAVHLAGLRVVPLTYLALEGVPSPDLAALGPADRLAHLTLAGTPGVDLRVLGQFPGLRSLTLHGPGAAGSLAALPAAAPHLEVLDLDDSGATDLGPLAGMKLRTLRFRRCDVKDVAALAQLPDLAEVDCDYRGAYDPVFKAHPKLRRINGLPRDQFFGRPPE